MFRQLYFVHFLAVLLAFSLPGHALDTHNYGHCAPQPTPGAPPDPSFCSLPPTVPELDLDKYANGVWYQIYGSGSATRFSGNSCVTANYTLNSEGNVDVLNCQHAANMARPICTVGIASARPGVNESSKLVVSFPNTPKGIGNPGNYNVAALLGSSSTGYLAAAVYQCLQPPEGPGLPGFYILSRTPHCPEWTLQALLAQLRCRGYDVSGEFTPIAQENCKYFFDSGFDIFKV